MKNHKKMPEIGELEILKSKVKKQKDIFRLKLRMKKGRGLEIRD